LKNEIFNYLEVYDLKDSFPNINVKLYVPLT